MPSNLIENSMVRTYGFGNKCRCSQMGESNELANTTPFSLPLAMPARVSCRSGWKTANIEDDKYRDLTGVFVAVSTMMGLGSEAWGDHISPSMLRIRFVAGAPDG